mmetsp:Transcript_13182/g.31588  ORF Transcript_13182/g.31588 Transcript_13182/m.31588 type:complete len:1491 (+) Transcript_13182:121-4593(+)
MTIPLRCQCILFFLAFTILLVSSQQDEGEHDCIEGLRQFNPVTQKRVYNVGVHASAGIETARMEFNLTFDEYLNEVVGKRWDPPIEFQMKITDDSIRDWLENEEDIDFMYTDTGIYSCIGIEIGAQPLATTISRLNSRRREYDLDVFAGTIMTLADNDDINSIRDLKGKVIGAQNFADFAGSQAQMYMMLQEQVNPYVDVKKVIFTGNNEDTIQGVLDGRWDVGFVRTGQVERTTDPSTGQPVDRDLLKIIAPRIFVMDNGELFPFLHSTPVFPEWPFAAKNNLDHIVTQEVSRALMALSSHATVGRLIAECYEAATNEAERRTCDNSPPDYFYPNARCDTTRDLAILAYNAEKAGFHTGFRSPRSHFAVRTMQQDGGFIIQDEKDKWRCERNSNYYNGIICPDGYYKVAEDIFATQCDNKGFGCADGYTCYCQPCIRAFDVSVFPKYTTEHDKRPSEFNKDNGCPKMSVCGEFQQRELAVFHAFDNLRRGNATMMIKKTVGETEAFISGSEISPFLYEFEFSRSKKGLGILEIFVDGEQISESPVQVEIIGRDCEAAYPGFNRVPDVDGECVCSSDTIEVDGSCVPSDIREVTIFPWMVDGESVLNLSNDTTFQSGCDKMSLCGTVPQTKEIVFKAQDNRKRLNATVTALLLLGIEERWLAVTEMEPHVYQFGFSHNERTVAIVELFVDGVQIPSSPFRVDVSSRDCNADFPGTLMVPNDFGFCECSDSTIEIGGKCTPLGTFTAVTATIGVLIAFMIVYCAFRYKRKMEDKVWHVNPEELNFSHPVEVIGQGAFGVVLAAEYRGTRVAIKRIIPVETARTREASPSNAGMAGSNSIAILSRDPEVEEGGDSPATGAMSNSPDVDSLSDSDILGNLPIFEKKTLLQRLFPFLFQDEMTRMKLNLLGSTTSGSTTIKSWFAKLCPRCDEAARRQEEFKTEMRLLSRLRHPCITTVMGAIMTGHNPMMVMELMENGSLYDLLRNETLYTGGEIIMQIVRDVAQGLRFLHGSSPPTLHRDLKAKNILIDSRFRAKVADFGLATRNKSHITGTPFWMAPEYLLGKTDYTTSCDIYAFGMIIYEIYSRKIPYEGLHPRKVLRKVCDPRINYRPKIPGTCPKRMAEITTKCWSSNIRNRPGAEDLDRIFADMSSHDAEPLIDQEKTRLRTEVASGDMLYKVFPKKVADKLKAGQKVEPETHRKATVLFCDIVRFEDISQAMSSAKVNNMLDRLHVAFGALANKHEVFRVETIGDVWVGVTNLEGNQDSSNVQQIANFAIAAVATANSILIDEDEPSAGCIHIRVGFHSGSVVSNVVGSLNPRYALFGETMTTAARMESLSTSDRIQCSEASARILKAQAPEIPLRRRGKTAVKGKGHMITYWVGHSVSSPRSPAKSVPAAARGFDDKPTVGFHPSFHKSSGAKSSAAASRLDDGPNAEIGRSFPKTSKKKKKMRNRWAAPEDYDPSNSMPISILQKPRNKSIRRLSASSSISVSQ